MKRNPSISKSILYIAGVLVILAIIGILAFYITPGAAKENYTAVPVSRMDLTQAVTATGAVAADQESALAFDGNGGTIATVNVTVGQNVHKGQILTTLRSDILQSNLEVAEANVEAAQAQLSTLQNGAKPADITLYNQKAIDAQTSLLSTVHDAYLKTQDAVVNKTASFFTNAVSVNPLINVTAQSDIARININLERLVVGEDLTNWAAAMASDTPGQVSDIEKSQANKTITDAKDFLADLTLVMNFLTTGNSGLSQSTIDSYRSTVNAAASEVVAAESEYTASISGAHEAAATLDVQQSSSADSSIQAQTAVVAAAQAQADAAKSQIAHSQIVAPFDGIVTDVEPKIGEVFSAGMPAITLISAGPYKIDIQVSETDVATLAVGNAASVTLSAYGTATTFPATVTTISPAKNTTNGKEAYDVTLHFINNDPRILSGMTANVSIVTASSTGALAIPTGSVITKGNSTYVLAKNTTGQYIEKPVTLGITGTNGYVEVKTGLTESDSVASF